MAAAIESAAPETGAAPDRLGALAAAAYRGIAENVRDNVAVIEQLRGAPVRGLRLGGGGSLDRTFCATIARRLGRPVSAGPVEASAAGNAIAQFLASGALPSLAEGQARIAAAGEIRRFDP